MIESTAVLKCVTHMLCWTWAMYFSAAVSSENDQGSMNLASMPDATLHVADLPAGVALIPGAIELLGCSPKLHYEVAREVLRLGLASFLPPQRDQGGLVVAHDDSGVRAPYERAAAFI